MGAVKVIFNQEVALGICKVVKAREKSMFFFLETLLIIN